MKPLGNLGGNGVEMKRATNVLETRRGPNLTATVSRGFAVACSLLSDIRLLRQLLDYDPATGDLRWKVRDVSLFDGKDPKRMCSIWNSAFAGKVVAPRARSTEGYKIVTLFDRHYMAHRVAWAVYYGEAPPDMIDHINRVKGDNRIENLRAADPVINGRNQSKRSNNTSGANGIWEMKPKAWGSRWRVVIGTNGGIAHTKVFKCLGQAIRHRNEEYSKRGFSEGHGSALPRQDL